jgi:hypothetical protein
LQKEASALLDSGLKFEIESLYDSNFEDILIEKLDKQN